MSFSFLLFAACFTQNKLRGAGQSPAYTKEISTCLDDTMKKIDVAKIDLVSLNDLGNFCAQHKYWQLLLTDFDYRRAKFFRQDYDDKIMLWLVVTITASGVALSALQLITSYKLAASGRVVAQGDSKITLEASKISVQSSITGLLILTVSLAFFIVFVIKVYQFKEDQVSYPQYPGSSLANLGKGALGRAPEKASVNMPPHAISGDQKPPE
jgi:hypothetical protein